MAGRIACRRGENSSSSSSSEDSGEEREKEGAVRETQPAAKTDLPRHKSQKIRVSYPRNWGRKVVLQSWTPSNEEPPPEGGYSIREGGMSAPFNIDNDITHAPSIGDTGEMRETGDNESLVQSKDHRDPARDIRKRETGTAAEVRPPQLLRFSHTNLKRVQARVT